MEFDESMAGTIVKVGKEVACRELRWRRTLMEKRVVELFGVTKLPQPSRHLSRQASTDCFCLQHFRRSSSRWLPQVFTPGVFRGLVISPLHSLCHGQRSSSKSCAPRTTLTGVHRASTTASTFLHNDLPSMLPEADFHQAIFPPPFFLSSRLVQDGI